MRKGFKCLKITLVVLLVLAFTVACTKDVSVSQDDMLEEANYFLFMGDSLSELSVNHTKMGLLFQGPDLPSS